MLIGASYVNIWVAKAISYFVKILNFFDARNSNSVNAAADSRSSNAASLWLISYQTTARHHLLSNLPPLARSSIIRLARQVLP